MEFIYDDGGRAAAGYKGLTGDCVARAIAIATETPYQEVYDALNVMAKRERPVRGRKSQPRDGVWRKTYQAYLEAKGWRWKPTMAVGTGCTTHLTDRELPAGRIIVRLSRHVAAVVDGVLHDTYNGSRGGTRCVYGYFWREA